MKEVNILQNLDYTCKVKNLLQKILHTGNEHTNRKNWLGFGCGATISAISRRRHGHNNAGDSVYSSNVISPSTWITVPVDVIEDDRDIYLYYFSSMADIFLCAVPGNRNETWRAVHWSRRTTSMPGTFVTLCKHDDWKSLKLHCIQHWKPPYLTFWMTTIFHFSCFPSGRVVA